MLVKSSTDRIWNIKNEIYATSENIVDVLLENRGMSHDIFDVSLKNTMPDPYVFVDMQRAVERVVKAVEEKQPIAILGDYDVDGISSTAIFVKFFKQIGAEHDYMIPHRVEDGYGLNTKNIDKFRDCLIIAVDNGATALKELAYAYSLGIEIVVIDHHEMLTIPENTIVVDPFRPDDFCEYRYLCAAGLVMMAVIGINRLLRQRGFYQNIQEPNLNEYLDLVALATICDVMPLIGLNRAFVKVGLRLIENRKNIGIYTMMKMSSYPVEINSESIGFFFGPRLNAAGRLDSASISLKLLITDDANEAEILAAKLEQLNEERKKLDQTIIKFAEKQADFSQKFICAWGEGWHEGVIGIVAGRLKEKYNKPTIVISCKSDICQASCRSTVDVDISKIIQQGIERQLILSGGGHAIAGGFLISQNKIADFVEFLKAYDLPEIQPKEFSVDCRVLGDNLDFEFVEKLNTLEPFGECNARPRFVIENVFLESIRIIKEQHISLSLKNLPKIRAISFKSVGTSIEDIIANKVGEFCSLLGTVSFSCWREQKYISLILEDIA